MIIRNAMKKKSLNLGIIAAGEGSRLKAEGICLSKPLVPINGIPLIQRIIDITRENGISSTSCIINETSRDLENFLRAYNYSHTFNLIVKSTPSSLHSLHHLNQFLTPPFLLTTADSVFDAEEFASFLNYGMDLEEADGIIAVTDFIDDEKPLYADIDENGRIKNFDDDDNDYEFVTGGLYLFKKNIEREINGAINSGVSRLRNFLRYLIKSEYRLYAYPFSKIIDVDHVSDIVKAEEFLNKSGSKHKGLY